MRTTPEAHKSADVLKLADVLVVDIQRDFIKHDLGNLKTGHVEISALGKSFKVIGDFKAYNRNEGA